jgi:hypothetical protein
VPAGLDSLTPALQAMVDFYVVSEDLITAAARRSPPLPESTDAGQRLEDWIARQSRDDLRKLVRGFLAGDAATTRAETLSRVRDETGAADWPCTEPSRTLAQLRELAGELHEERLQKAQKAREKAHRKQLKAIAAEPNKAIAQIEKLVKERSARSYDQAAQQLADVREALGPKQGAARARTVAEKLRRENPRLHLLIAALRKRGLLE